MVLDVNNFFDLIQNISYCLLPFFLYCELHFKMRWFRGFIYKNQPEILFDVPTRITTDKLPVLLMVKDSHRFPVHIDGIEILIMKNGQAVKHGKIKFNKNLLQVFFSQIFYLDIKEFYNNELEVECTLFIRKGNRIEKIVNHNLSKKHNENFRVFLDNENLAIPDNWLQGDLHVHSNYTEDQVEFGAELSSYIEMGKARSLNFVGILDHSYDFDDAPGTWNVKDKNFPKWQEFKQEVEKINAENEDFTIIPGYELSVDNGLGENVHMAVLNNKEIFDGTGDAMENYKSYPSENYYQTVLDKLDPQAVAYAAHPNAPQKFFHRKILKRGEWNARDFANKLAGYQIFNGNKSIEFKKGKKIWIEKLLTGKRLNVFAGTDAHGNFNYNLSIKYPLLSLEKNNEHVFGEFITFIKSAKGVGNIVENIKAGKVVISEGPFLNLEIKTNDALYGIGDEINFLPEQIEISAVTNNYFGKIDCIRLIVGNCRQKIEQSLELLDIDKIHYFRQLGIKLHADDCYIRAEMTTAKNKIALTNPIWVNPAK